MKEAAAGWPEARPAGMSSTRVHCVLPIPWRQWGGGHHRAYATHPPAPQEAAVSSSGPGLASKWATQATSGAWSVK